MSGHELLLNVAGGVALLLWATRMIRTGVMRAYGGELRRVLGRSTRSRLRACGVGMGVAALVQSSTATALLAVAFASRGFIAVAPGLAVMLGADVGSTLVVQVLSFDVRWLAPVFILLGVTVFLSSSLPVWRNLGRVAIGLGLMLLSLTLIVSASSALRDSNTLPAVLSPLAGDPILALLVAAALTWVAHSSVAIVLLVMSFAVAGIVPPTLAVALVLGANIGAGLVPFFLCLSEPPAARRIPLGNLLFRGIGALALLPFVALLGGGLDVLGSDTARQIANFHTLFNLALAALALPWIGPMGRLTERIYPSSGGQGGPVTPKYLDPAAVATPSEALAGATRETLRMADVVEEMLHGTMDVFRNNDARLLERLSRLDDDVDTLHEAIKLYLTRVSREHLSDEESRRCMELINFATNLEHVGDIIDKNLLEIATQKIEHKLTFSEAGSRELDEMHSSVVGQFQIALGAFIGGEAALARKLVAEKKRVSALERQGNRRHLGRLRSGQTESLETSGLHLDMLRDLKRISSHLASVAYPILDRQRAPDPVERAESGGDRVSAEDTGGAHRHVMPMSSLADSLPKDQERR